MRRSSRYTKERQYTLSQHGFARDMEFDLESQTEEEIWFVLKDTESTLEKYPFHFILKVGYRLSGRQVEVMWKVENPNDKKMYFSIGGHPAFNCPLKEGEKQEDCQLIFDTEGPLTSSIVNEEGALCPRTKILNLFGKCLKLEEHLFDEDALIIENHQAQRIGLADADGKVYLEVEFDAPLFGIWSPAKKHAPFVCIEHGMEEVTEKILTIFWKTGSGGMNWNRAIFLKRIIRFW